MKTVVNKTHAPLKVPLPRGKSLRLGPLKEGQIRDEHAEHPPLKKLVDKGSIEVFDAGSNTINAGGPLNVPHESSRGQGSSTGHERGGDR